jgi:hypothetical protein
MKKKELKARIKELEIENTILHTQLKAVSYPVYIYLYRYLPYNPYWYDYTYPMDWRVEPSTTWTISGGSTSTQPPILYDTTAIDYSVNNTDGTGYMVMQS